MARFKRDLERDDLEREMITSCEEAADRFVERGDAEDILDLVRKLARLAAENLSLDKLRKEVARLEEGSDERPDGTHEEAE